LTSAVDPMPRRSAPHRSADARDSWPLPPRCLREPPWLRGSLRGHGRSRRRMRKVMPPTSAALSVRGP